MTKNIKEIGKELLGKSLNSFHRKTGLTQLEENNKMQDGILNGILSQVDDAYIEKTEQSNVIHLDGSGDGVVVLDSIEGNTMVNLVKLPEVNERTRNTSSAIICLQIGNSPNSINLKTNATYTCFVSYDIKNISSNCQTYMEGQIKNSDNSLTWFNTSDRPNSVGSYRVVKKVDTSNISKTLNNFYVAIRSTDGQDANATIKLNNIMLLEGDWTDKEIPQYFEGLQSSFEESTTDEGKYEIEILMKNRNLLGNNNKDLENWIDGTYLSKKIQLKPNTTYSTFSVLKKAPTSQCVLNISRVPYTGDNSTNSPLLYTEIFNTRAEGVGVSRNRSFTTDASGICYLQYYENGHRKYLNNIDLSQWFDEICDVTITEGYNVLSNHIEPKQNKIKLLINEPLRAISNNIKDRLCVKDGKLVIERKCGQVVFDGTIDVNSGDYKPEYGIQIIIVYGHPKIDNKKTNSQKTINSTLPCIIRESYGYRKQPNFSGYVDTSAKFVGAIPNTTGVAFNHTELNQYFVYNPMQVVYELETPIYEEVLNEYGEPIILEGYENGTLYIDSTIVPTTTIRYTPKMESFKAVKEVKSNNSLLSNDINESIIPYMMEVDMLIMEKEMSLFNSLNKNIRKMEVLDMTNMQKRTYDMLARLIKGKTLNEQECKTRVTVYLNAGKITDEQAKELNFLIDEIYA